MLDKVLWAEGGRAGGGSIDEALVAAGDEGRSGAAVSTSSPSS